MVDDNNNDEIYKKYGMVSTINKNNTKDISETVEKVLSSLEQQKINLDKLLLLHDTMASMEKFITSIAYHVMYIENVLGIDNHDLSGITGVPNGKD